MYSYKTGLGQVWVGSKLPPNSGSNIIWLRPSDDHRVLWEIRTYNIYKERWEVLTSATLTADGLLILIRDLEKRCKSLEELKVVLYNTIQNLTPEEQKIARQNIGAISLEDLPPQVEVLQEVGSSTTAVMSQNAVTEELSKKASVESVTDGISAHNTSSTSHADIRKLLNTCVGLPAYDSSSYKITFTTLAGVTAEIDLPIEQLALRYNAETESIEFDNADGTTTSIPVSAFVKEYVGSIGDRIQISIDENNVIHATVLKNSIDWDCLSFELQERINDHVTSADFAANAVRTDITQTLSIEAQNQALKNIGANLMIIDIVNGQAVLTEEQEARLLSSKGVILRGTTASPEVLSHIFHSDIQTGDVVGFCSFRKNDYCLTCQYTKSTKTFKVIGNAALRDNSAVVFNREQSLTASQQEQALANLGMKVYVTDSSFIGSTLSAEEIEEVYVSKAILFTDTGDLFSFGVAFPSEIYFYRFRNRSTIGYIMLNYSSGLVSEGLFPYQDVNAVSFNNDQSDVSNDRKNKALGNIGIDFVRIPYSLLGTTLSDEMANVINNARGIILVDTPNDFILPTIYNKGRTTSSSAKFITIGETKDVYYILYNKNTKALAKVVHTYTDSGCVRYVQEQNLTNTEKDTVLSNIGLDFVQVDYSLLGTTLTDEMFAVLDNAKGIILVDPPSGYYNPRVFIKGNNGSTGCFFVSFATGTTYCQIELNKSTKVLSGVNAGLTYGGSVRYTEEQSLTDTQKQQALANINAVGSSMIKGVEIVYGTAPMQEDNILYIELEETT